MIDLAPLTRWLGDWRPGGGRLPRGRMAAMPMLPLSLPALSLPALAEPALAEPGGLGGDPAGESAGPGPPPLWPAARIEIAEQIWGEGFVLPGGAEEVLRQIKPMVLTEAETLLLLGAGPFGAAKAIHTDRKCWIEAFERDPDLLGRAQFRAELAGLRKRAPCAPLVFPPSFRRRFAHHALVMQTCHGDSEILPLVNALAEAVRGGGQLDWVELVRGDSWAGAAARRWLAMEQRETAPPQPQQIGAALRRDFDVRIVENISKRHVQQVLGGWARHLERIKRNQPPRATMARVVSEAEVWLQRVRLIEAGQLHLVRWLALRKN